MEMTGLQIFKYLPGGKKEEFANCKKCGCPTCMAFALKLAKQNVSIEQCPYISDELFEKYSHSIKHPQNTVEICGMKVGGENVLYRHEKTFINPTILAVVVDCSSIDYRDQIKRICDFEITAGVNENLKVDLIILKNCQNNELCNDLSVPVISIQDYEKLPIDNIYDENFNNTKDYLISTRKKAIIEKDENYSRPVCTWLKSDNIYETCAKASFYICKYSNMIVFEHFDEAMFSTLLRLRQNIFTNPQKPLQVEAGLYEFNEPNENSIIFLTTNFALTFFAVANELENLNVSSYLIVIPADGMSVLTAWSAEKFTANIVANTIKNFDVENKVNTRKIIIPGLLSHIVEELKEAVPEFDFVVGTHEASAIAEFVKNLN